MSVERGSATMTAVIAAGVLLACAVAAAIIGGPIATGQRASQAADLAALAGSAASLDQRDGCDAARAVARANGAHLVACRMDADVATVTVRAERRSPWGSWGSERKARAAPLTYLQDGPTVRGP